MTEGQTQIETGITNDGKFVIKLNTIFDFTIANQFEAAYSQIKEDIDGVVLDFQNIKVVNTVSLGMLLDMHEKVSQAKGIEISIINLSDDINKQLVRLCLDELFFI